MAHDEACWTRLMASEHMELATTQGRVDNFHDDIGRFLDLGYRPVLYGHFVGLFEDDCFHCVFSHCRFGSVLCNEKSRMSDNFSPFNSRQNAILTALGYEVIVFLLHRNRLRGLSPHSEPRVLGFWPNGPMSRASLYITRYSLR